MPRPARRHSSSRILRRWLRPGIAATAGVATWFIAPNVIPNSAFRLLSLAAVVILVADFPYLRVFWARTFTRPRLRLPKQPWPLFVAQLAFCCLVTWFLVGSLVSPVTLIWGFAWLPVILAALVILAVLPSFYRGCVVAAAWFDVWNKGRQVLAVGVILGIFFTAEFLIGAAVRVVPDWDAGTIYSNAAGLATGSLQTIDADYYSMYPNNIMLTLALASYLRVLHEFGAADLYLAAIALNAVVMTTAVLLVAVVTRRIAGTATAIFSLLPCVVFIALSPWVAVPYSDTLGMVFPVLLLYLFLLSRSATKPIPAYSFCLAAGLVAAVGFYIKPTIVFVLVASTVVVLFARGDGGRKRRSLAAGAVFLVVALGGFASGQAAIKAAVATSPAIGFDLYHNDKEFPVTHFLKMGSTGLGGFNGADVAETKSIDSVRDRFQNGIDVYLDRVSGMGLWGYLDFLNVKGKAIMGDGSFFNWGEGMARKPVELSANDPLSRAIQDYFYYQGPHFAFLRGFWQSFWIVTLVLVAAPLLLRSRYLEHPGAAVMRLSLLALMLFLLFFEGRSRYLYMYVPFFILLASLTVAALASRTGGAEAALCDGHEDVREPEHRTGQTRTAGA